MTRMYSEAALQTVDTLESPRRKKLRKKSSDGQHRTFRSQNLEPSVSLVIKKKPKGEMLHAFGRVPASSHGFGRHGVKKNGSAQDNNDGFFNQ